MHVRVRSHWSKAKQIKEHEKEIKEKISNIKENFRFRFLSYQISQNTSSDFKLMSAILNAIQNVGYINQNGLSDFTLFGSLKVNKLC